MNRAVSSASIVKVRERYCVLPITMPVKDTHLAKIQSIAIKKGAGARTPDVVANDSDSRPLTRTLDVVFTVLVEVFD